MEPSVFAKICSLSDSILRTALACPVGVPLFDDFYASAAETDEIGPLTAELVKWHKHEEWLRGQLDFYAEAAIRKGKEAQVEEEVEEKGGNYDAKFEELQNSITHLQEDLFQHSERNGRMDLLVRCLRHVPTALDYVFPQQ